MYNFTNKFQDYAYLTNKISLLLSLIGGNMYLDIQLPYSDNFLNWSCSFNFDNILNFRQRRWGSSLSAPHRHQRKFSGTRVCRVTFKHLPQPLKSHIRSFRNLGQLLKFSKKTFKKPKNAGVNFSFFCENKPPVKFQNSN